VRRAPRLGGAGGRPRSRPAVGRATVAALCAVSLALVGCGSAATQQNATALEGAGGGVTARLRMSPAPAPVMKPVRLSVALSDESGRPVAGRTVAFDLSMPAMTMAPNRPKVSEMGDGVYEATTLLSMAGDWLLTVEIDSPGRQLKIPLTFAAD
jgi:YtkA-like